MNLKPILLSTATEPFKMPYHKTIPKSDLVLGLIDSPKYSKGLGLTTERGTIGNFSKEMYQNIYLIDETAEIIEGDLLINIIDKSFHKVATSGGAEFYSTKANYAYKKIIASTDSSLGLPLLSEQSIKLLIDYYNKNGKMPESVGVEEDLIPTLMEGRRWDDKEAGKPNGSRPFYMKSIIKLDSKGTVDISISEDRMWNEKELEDILDRVISDTISATRMYLKNPNLACIGISGKDWIKENLK